MIQNFCYIFLAGIWVFTLFPMDEQVFSHPSIFNQELDPLKITIHKTIIKTLFTQKPTSILYKTKTPITPQITQYSTQEETLHKSIVNYYEEMLSFIDAEHSFFKSLDNLPIETIKELLSSTKNATKDKLLLSRAIEITQTIDDPSSVAIIGMWHNARDIINLYDTYEKNANLDISSRIEEIKNNILRQKLLYARKN